MNSKFDEKIAIAYFCAGESYRESVVKQLENHYFDDDNLYYLIITDNKEYFNSVNRKNLIVNELKDFYAEYPHVEKYEALIESTDKSDYAKQFVGNNYVFSFSLMRFHLLQAIKLGIKNISLTCTDTNINFDVFTNELIYKKTFIRNAVSEWDSPVDSNNMNIIKDFIENQQGPYKVDSNVRVLDAAGRFFTFKDELTVGQFFIMWDRIIKFLFETKQIELFRGSYVYNDEYILAPLYNAFKMNLEYTHSQPSIYNVNHNQKYERFWSLGSAVGGLKEHTDYNEYLKINNLQNG